MTTPFRRPNRSAEEIAVHKEKRLVEKVVRNLEGMPEPQAPKIIDNSNKGIADNRIREINLTTDVGWGDSNAVRLSQHHVRNAVSVINSYAYNWSFNTMRGGPGGWNDLGEAVTRMIKSLNTRIDPATHVAKAEFDPTGELARRYEHIEASHLDKIGYIKRQFDKLLDAARKESRSRIRQIEIKELQVVIDSMAYPNEKWANDFSEDCHEMGLLNLPCS